MSRTGQIVIAGLLGFCLFLVGIWLAVPKMASKNVPEAPTAVGKPEVAVSRRTPVPAEPAPLPVQTRAPDFPQRTPTLSTGKDAGWVVSEGARVHQGPGLDSPTIATLKYGKRVQMVSSEEGWQKISFDGRQTGWLQSQFVSSHRPEGLPQEGPEDAIKALTAFYQDIGKKKIGSAYDRLSFEFKRSLSYAQFQAGYGNAEGADVRITKTESLGPERYMLYAELQITDPKGVHGYRGEYVATLEQGVWKLSQGNIQPVDLDKMAPFSPSGDASPDKPAFPDPTPTPGEEEEDP